MNDDNTEFTGANEPPKLQLLHAMLAEKYEPLLMKRSQELTAQLNALPDPLPDDKLDEASELLKSTQVQLRKIDTTRQTEKEPFLESERIVDGYFKGLSHALALARDRMRPVYETAHDLRAETARRAAEEEARKRREAADKARQEAEERARLQREAAEKARLEAEEAERKRQEETAKLKAAPSVETEFQQRQAAIEARRLQQHAEQQEASAAEAEKIHERAENRAEVAHLIEHKVETAKPAEFARLRTDHGVVATQVAVWDFLITDRDKLPKILLWKYISREAIDSAIKAAIDNGVREMKGVKIFQRRTSIIK